MSSVAAEQAVALDPGATGEPSAGQSFRASFSAIVFKESRWRMRGRRAFVIVTIYVSLLAFIVFTIQRNIEHAAMFSFDGSAVAPGFVSGAVSSAVGQSIFSLLLAFQLLLVLVLAPALTSGAISMAATAARLARPGRAVGIRVRRRRDRPARRRGKGCVLTTADYGPFPRGTTG